MTKEKFHIDNYFTDGLNDLEVTPPPDVWNNIEKHLDKKKKVRIIFIWSAMAAGLLLLIGIGSYMNSELQQNTNITKQPSIAIQQHKASKTQSLSNSPITNKNNSDVIYGSQENKDVPLHNNQNNSVVSSAPSSKKSLDKDIQETAELKNNQLIENFSNSNNSSLKNESNQIDQVALSNQNNKTKTNYLIPFGSNLQSKTKQGLILQPSNFQEVSPTNETDFLIPEIAETREVQKVNKWSIAGQLAPLYSYRTSNQTNTSDQNKEKGLMAYSGGIKVDYKTSRRFSIQAGIYYSIMGQTVENIKISSIPTGNQVAVSTPDQVTSSKGNINIIVLSTSNSMGPIVNRNQNSSSNLNVAGSKVFYGNSSPNSKNDLLQSYNNTGIVANAKNGNIVQKLDFIEIPLLARYKIIDKKMGIHLLGGFSTNFLINNYATLNQDGNSENIGQTEGLNTVNYSSTIGFGINYEIFKKIDLSFEPTYKYYLKSISSNKDNVFRPFSFGLFTGLTYKF